jgi:hypothetical protein
MMHLKMGKPDLSLSMINIKLYFSLTISTSCGNLTSLKVLTSILLINACSLVCLILLEKKVHFLYDVFFCEDILCVGSDIFEEKAVMIFLQPW